MSRTCSAEAIAVRGFSRERKRILIVEALERNEDQTTVGKDIGGASHCSKRQFE